MSACKLDDDVHASQTYPTVRRVTLAQSHAIPRNIVLGASGRSEHPVFDVQLIDLFVNETSDGTEGCTHIALPICIERPETRISNPSLDHMR